ncbi:MAG: hypothetical protein R2741_03830 [Methanolobus sp.]
MSKSSKKKQSSASSNKAVDKAKQDSASPGFGRSAYKPKTPEEKRKAHKEGIIKTAVAAIVGIIAGIIAYTQLGTGEDKLWYATLMIVAGFSYYGMRLIFPMLKVRTKEFGFKDWFYVEFIVIDFCLVTWTLLLN